MPEIEQRVKWRWYRVLAIWNRTSIRAQGGIVALIPVVAILVSFGFAVYGNYRRGGIEYDIHRRFTLVRQYNYLLNLMIDAETGERGYLLTQQPEFLAPYEAAVREIPAQLAELKQTIIEEPGEEPRLERLQTLNEISRLVDLQLESLKRSQGFVLRNNRPDDLVAHLRGGKSYMDGIRTLIEGMQAHDAELLNERIAEINTIRVRDYGLVCVALLIGLLMRWISFYLFDRGIVRRINRLTENVSLLREGERMKYPPSKKADAVGMLEQQIAMLGERQIDNPDQASK